PIAHGAPTTPQRVSLQAGRLVQPLQRASQWDAAPGEATRPTHRGGSAPAETLGTEEGTAPQAACHNPQPEHESVRSHPSILLPRRQPRFDFAASSRPPTPVVHSRAVDSASLSPAPPSSYSQASRLQIQAPRRAESCPDVATSGAFDSAPPNHHPTPSRL
ncbi:hypothetical protein TOPH_02106, partial [Tolypocladium ophioglossoides CBS 100239]